MNLFLKKIFVTVTALRLSLTESIGALAITNSWACVPQSGESTYKCASQYAYTGHDEYGVDQYSETVRGTRHGCTSFAAHQLYLFNSYMPAIAHFNSAQYWDTDARDGVGATLSLRPHLGDIAQWNAKPTGLVKGHVAWVEEITYKGTGSVDFVLIVDDNAGLGFTSKRKLYPEVNSGVISWPDTFITFPGFSGGGSGAGKPPSVMSVQP